MKSTLFTRLKGLIKFLRLPVITFLFTILFFQFSFSQDVQIMTLKDDQAEDTISRHIYGHFAEHLGRGIYDGIWLEDETGEYNIRMDVVEALKDIQIPNLRWPGGCFAEYYFWKDGVGPKEDRPNIVNVMWGGVTEDNSVGTHEFMELIELLDTESIIVGNVGSGSVQEMAEWWEYINHPGPGPMADLREKHGREDPWNVKFWGIGNESWGCGGNMRAEFYADEYRRYQTFLNAYEDVQPYRIAAGAYGEDYEWTEVLMERAGNYMEGLDFHYYIWGGHATEFEEEEYFQVMRDGRRIEELINGHSDIMDKYDPEKRVSLIVGEWGVWLEPMEDTNPRFLHQQNSIRDALVASQLLNIFNHNADRVRMANIAQTVNVLQAMILTEGEQMLLTPTYHVFEFYNVHHDAVHIPMVFDAGTYEYEGESIPAITASASKNEDDKIHITMSNLNPDSERNIEAVLRESEVSSVSGRILTADQMTAHNTFENPEVVAPAPFEGANIVEGRLKIDLPPMSLVVLELE